VKDRENLHGGNDFSHGYGVRSCGNKRYWGEKAAETGHPWPTGL
jgi:hypothetical protein